MKLATGELIAASMETDIDAKNIIPDSLSKDVPVMVSEGLQKYKQ